MSKNIAYFVYSGGYADKCFEACLKSLRKHNSTCVIEVFAYDLSEREEKFLSSKPIRALVTKLRKEEWEGLIQTCKVEKIKALDMAYGDHVLVLDTDLVFREDPFKLFEKEFDVVVTSRYYRHSNAAQGGVWGFRYNENSEKFLDFHIAQIRQPTWEPYRVWKDEFGHHGLAWRVNQDFLCVCLLKDQIDRYGKVLVPWIENKRILETLRNSTMPFQINLLDAGPDWNHDSSISWDKEGLFHHSIWAIYFSDIKIVHLKNILHRDPWLRKLGLIDRGPLFYLQYCYFWMYYLAGKVRRAFAAPSKEHEAAQT